MKDFINGNPETQKLSQRALLTQAMAGESNSTSYLLPNQEIDCSHTQTTSQLTAEFESNGGGDEGHFTFTDAQGIKRYASMSIVSQYTSVDSLVYNEDKTTAPSVIGLTFIGAASPPLYPDSYVLQVFIEKPDYQEGEINLQGVSTNLMLFKVIDKNTTPATLELISAGRSGSIELSEVGNGSVNSPIEGSISAQMGLIKKMNYLTTEY